MGQGLGYHGLFRAYISIIYRHPHLFFFFERICRGHPYTTGTPASDLSLKIAVLELLPPTMLNVPTLVEQCTMAFFTW
jgi:hypothetical protein